MPSVNNNIPAPSGPILNATEIGDATDVYNRLIGQLPPWFGTLHPVLNVVLQAYIYTGVFNYSQLVYDNQQMRLQTATGDNLDLISQDYFENGLPRRTGEDDDSFRSRISANLLQERATRNGMESALYKLTGFYPIIFEPFNFYDCGAYNVIYPYVSLAYADPNTPGTGTGSYGSGSYPYQCFITVFVSQYQGMASYSGYDDYYFGYDAAGGLARGWYGGQSLERTIISDYDIYQTINLTKDCGTVCWVMIERTAV